MNLLNGPQNGLPKCLFLPPFKEWCAQKHRRKLLENSHTCRVDENYPWASSGKSLVLCSTIGNYWMRSLLMFFSVSYLNDKKLYAVWVSVLNAYMHACVSAQVSAPVRWGVFTTSVLKFCFWKEKRIVC